MAIPRFFKIPQHRKFDYDPLYYDERKEKMKERLGKINLEKNPKKGEYIPNIKGKMKSYYKPSSTVGKQTRMSNIRLIIFIVILTALAYYLFYY